MICNILKIISSNIWPHTRVSRISEFSPQISRAPRMQPREKFLNAYLKISCTSVAHITLFGIRLNRVATAFFVAHYCASRSCQARALNGNVYLKAHEMTRLSLYVIICGDVSKRWMTGGFQRFWFLRIPRGVSYLFVEAWSDDR